MTNKEVIDLKNTLIQIIKLSSVPEVVTMYILRDIEGQLGAVVNAELIKTNEEAQSNELQQGKRESDT